MTEVTSALPGTRADTDHEASAREKGGPGSTRLNHFEEKSPPMDNGGGRLDPAVYFSEELRLKEWSMLWSRVWLVAGRVSDLSEPGDYITFKIEHESILVVRTKEGKLKAFYNVCLHRGNRLAHSTVGSAPHGFSCSYHGWRYEVDGSLAEITQRERFPEEAICDLKGLSPVHVDEWGGFVFVSLNPEPEPLLEYLGVIPDHLEPYHFERLVVVSDMVTEWPVNWKTAVDNFSESYHVNWVHPGIPAGFDENHQYDLYSNGISRTLNILETTATSLPSDTEAPDKLKVVLYDLGEDPKNFTGTVGELTSLVKRLRAERAELLGLDVERIASAHVYYSLFPNCILSVHPEGILFLQVLPTQQRADRCELRIMVLVHPIDDPNYNLPDYIGLPPGTDLSGDERPDQVRVPFGEPLGGVLDEDVAIVPYVQQGMASAGFRGLVLGEQEQRIRHFHSELRRYLDGNK